MEKAKKWKIREFLGEVLDWIIYLSGKSWFQTLLSIVLAIVSSLVGLAFCSNIFHAPHVTNGSHNQESDDRC